MNKIKLLFSLLVLGFVACTKDNYDGPTAGLSGRFVDAQTGVLVEQDIIRGTQIQLLEHGYDPVTPQFLIVKNDGTYENSLLFANSYTVQPLRGNFIEVPAQEVSITGKTVLDFTVTPYIRIQDAQIAIDGSKVKASFKLEQTVINNVKKIGLYAHSDTRVGEPMRLVAAEQELNAASDPAVIYELEIDLPSNSNNLKPGNSYYFRVGALIDVGEAKLNYAPAVKIGIN